MSRLMSGMIQFVGVLAAVAAVASASGLGWAQPRDATVPRGPMSERPLILVQGGCKNTAAFNACQAQENNAPGGCNWASSCTGKINADCYAKHC